MTKLIPHNYQANATLHGITNPRTYFAVDMGMGKTLITLQLLEALQKHDTIKGSLVIAPLGPVYNTWPQEIKKWGIDLSYTILHGPDRDHNLKQKRDIYLINFEGLPWLFDTLVAMSKKKGAESPFDALVIDEASMVKSGKTKRFKLLKQMRTLFPKFRYMLSGTPAPNGYLDLWSQYYLLTDGEALGHGITYYRKKYFTQDPWEMYSYTLNEGADIEILEKIKPFTFRLDAKDYLKLPDVILNEIKINLSTKAKALYKKLEKEFFLELEKVEIEAFNSASLSMKLRQFLQGSLYYTKPEEAHLERPPRYVQHVHDEKLKALADIYETSGGKPLLVAINFKFEKDMIENIFPRAKFIVGGMGIEVKNKYIRQWNRGEIDMLVCHPASIGHGTNLQTGGHIVVWYGLTWSLELYQQFNKRLDRQGQLMAVIIHHILADKTIDQRIFRALNVKGVTQQGILDYLRGEVI